MSTYITLYRFTFKGTIKDFPNALKAIKAEEEAASVKFINFYLTMGQYDAVGIVEAPG